MIGLLPTKYRLFAKEVGTKKFRLLDVGCGNHSVRQAMRWFPNCEYYGIDRGIYKNDPEDFQLMKKYYDLDLTVDTLESVQDEFFDVIVVNHVIEHLSNAEYLLSKLPKKLRPGGRIYIEFPSVRSLSLPSMSGTLNFCDDPTHIRIYDVKEVANILLANGCRIIKGGVRRDWVRIIMFPVLLLRGIWKNNLAGPFWDITGFADYVYACVPRKISKDKSE